MTQQIHILKKIVGIIKQQKEANTLDPQVNFWAAVLSDSYVSNTNPESREKCLKRACYLKNLVYGSAHTESINCLSKLACYYLDQNEVNKAIHILSLSQEILDKKEGRNPDRLGDTINLLAIKYKTDHKYKQSKALELFVLDKARCSTSGLHKGLPAFYSLLGMNALAQSLNTEGREYFQKALFACTKIKNKHERKLAEQYIDLLTIPSFLDIHQQKIGIAELELRHILAMEQIINADKNILYKTYPLLAAAIISKQGANYSEYAKCINNAIAIAKLSNSGLAKDIPDLYMRLGMTDSGPGSMEKANVAFANALKAETDKHGFHATLVLFWWGWELAEHGASPSEKLDTALKQAGALAPACRGTLLADILKLQANIFQSSGRADLAIVLEKQSAEEIKLQKKLNSKLGPDFYHRI